MIKVNGSGPIQPSLQKFQVHVCTHVPYLHTCIMLSKCSQSYTFQRIMALFPSHVYLRQLYLFVSTGGVSFRLFVCWVICFQSQKKKQFSEVASVACCLFAQYSKEGLLPSVAGTQQSNNPVHKSKGWMFKK